LPRGWRTVWLTGAAAIAARAPNMNLFLFLFAAFQLTLAGSYVVYKRRLAQSPKKYL
jgi:hypothetical protein